MASTPGVRTRATLVGGECSHHCATPTSQEVFYFILDYQKLQIELKKLVQTNPYLKTIVTGFAIFLMSKCKTVLIVADVFQETGCNTSTMIAFFPSITPFTLLDRISVFYMLFPGLVPALNLATRAIFIHITRAIEICSVCR